MKKKIVGIIIAVVLTVFIVIGAVSIASIGYSNSGLSENKTSSYSSDEMTLHEDADSELSLTPSTDAGGDVETDAGSGSSLTADRKLVKTVSISAETLEFDKTLASIESEIEKQGGYIEGSDVTGNGYDDYSLRTATLTVRIPADKLEIFTSGVGKLCNVVRKNETTRDETANYLDTESHLKALRAEEASLLALLQKAESVDNIIALQNRLSDVIYEIEHYESNLKKIDELVSFSTVAINLYEVEKDTPVVENNRSFGQKLADAFMTAVAELGEDAKAFAIGFMGILPNIIVFALILAVVLIVISIIRKKSAKRRRLKRQKIAETEKISTEEANTEEKE